jgi:hypothetical protein
MSAKTKSIEEVTKASGDPVQERSSAHHFERLVLPETTLRQVSNGHEQA